MANKLQLTITAVDKATAVVRRVNGSMSKLTQPAVRLGQSLRSLGREMGFDKMASRAVDAGRAVSDVGGKVAGLLGPLGALTAGGILAGLTAMTLEWSHMGAEVARTAQGLDIQVGQLQALRGAAGLAGLGAQELTGGLKSLGDTLEDALYGRNQQALVVLNRLGVGIHHTANGSIDAARGMRDLSEAISGIKNVQVQGLIAREFGLEAVLPLLRQGPAAIDAYQEKVKQLGGVMSGQAVESAQQFQLSLNYLSVATQGVRNAIGAKLLPILQPLVDRFTGLILANRELIATRIADFVRGLADSINGLDFKRISDDVHDFVGGVEKAVDKMGGWQNAAIALAVVLNGNLLASVINLSLAVAKLGLTSIPTTIRAFGLFQAAAAGGLLKAALFTDGLAGLAAGIPIVGTALSGLSSAFLAAGAAIEATPIGWLITAIAAVAFGVYAIYKNWDNIVSFFKEKINGVKAAFDHGWVNGIMKSLWEFNPTKLVADALNGLSKWLFGFDLYGAGRHVIGSLMQGLGVASLLPDSVKKLLDLDAAGNPIVPPAAVSAPGTPAAPASRAVQTSAPAPLGIRNNNPGNLREWGNTPRAGGYAVFPTVDAGLNAAARNLIVQQQEHGLNTIRGIVSRWAPPSENDTAAYISDVSGRTGFKADQQLNLRDPKVLAPLLSGIVRHEGNSAGVTDEMINSAVAAQLGAGAGGGRAGAQKVEVALTLHGLPAGVSASATTGGNSMPVRVAYSMPTGVTP